jgi:asparagine synthase (glutamine-hydrolysing)
MGFPTPLRQWLRESRAAHLFDIMRAKDGLLAAYVDPGKLDGLLSRQISGREDVTDRIWRLLTLQIWGDMFLTGKREERWEGLMAAARHTV